MRLFEITAQQPPISSDFFTNGYRVSFLISMRMARAGHTKGLPAFKKDDFEEEWVSTPQWEAWYNRYKTEFDQMRIDYLTKQFSNLKRMLVKKGKITLYRTMALDYDLVKAIQNGKTDLGVHWAHNPEYIDEWGGGQYGETGRDHSSYKEQLPPEHEERDYWITAEVSPEAVNWESTLYLFVELNDFEHEINLLPKQPVHVLAIRTSDGPLEIPSNLVLHT